MGRRASAPAPAPAAPAAAGGPPPPAPAAPPPGSTGPSTSGGRPASRWNAPGWAPTAGGIVLGALADVLFVQYMRGGWAEVRAWLGAKFLNNSAGPEAPFPGDKTGSAGGGPAPAGPPKTPAAHP